MDPETAWDLYMKGNGSSKMASALNDIGIDLSILQNQEVYKKFLIDVNLRGCKSFIYLVYTIYKTQ